MPFVQTKEATLYYEAAGSGTRTLFFIHGLTLDHRMWEAQVSAFSEDYRVVTYDCRGFGQSSDPKNNDYNHADDIVAVMDHLGINRVVAVGLSMGGRILSQLAVRHPDRTEALVFVDSGLDGYKYSKEFSKVTYADVLKAYVTEGLEAAKKVWLGIDLFAPARRHAHVAKALKGMVNDYRGWHWKTDSNATPALTPPACDRLSEIRVPTLILVGELDAPDFHKISELLAAKIPHAERVIIPNAGHMANMEAPEYFNKVLRNFLDKL